MKIKVFQVTHIADQYSICEPLIVTADWFTDESIGNNLSKESLDKIRELNVYDICLIHESILPDYMVIRLQDVDYEETPINVIDGIKAIKKCITEKNNECFNNNIKFFIGTTNDLLIVTVFNNNTTKSDKNTFINFINEFSTIHPLHVSKHVNEGNIFISSISFVDNEEEYIKEVIKEMEEYNKPKDFTFRYKFITPLEFTVKAKNEKQAKEIVDKEINDNFEFQGFIINNKDIISCEYGETEIEDID